MALVLAGQRNQGALSARSDAVWEALIPIQGRPMLDYVLEALTACPAIEAVRVVGPELRDPQGSVREGGQPVTYIAPGGTLWDNLDRGLAGLAPDAPVLVATADIPLITEATVSAFVAAARTVAVDIVYPLVPRPAVEQAFPGVHRTYFRFRQGVFTGGNLFWVRPSAWATARPHAEQLLSHRKAPLKLAGDIGLGVLVRYLMGRLDLAEVERVAGRLLGVTGCGLPFAYPEVGVDVDKESDLDLAERWLGGGRQAVSHA